MIDIDEWKKYCYKKPADADGPVYMFAYDQHAVVRVDRNAVEFSKNDGPIGCRFAPPNILEVENEGIIFTYELTDVAWRKAEQR